jgi:hypothetical protein
MISVLRTGVSDVIAVASRAARGERPPTSRAPVPTRGVGAYFGTPRLPVAVTRAWRDPM